MRKKTLSLAFAGLAAVTTMSAHAGTISVKANDYQQVFEGAGGTIDGYLGHWISLNDENQDLAARMVAQDINLAYVKNYMSDYPDVIPDNYTNFAEAVNDLKVYNPDLRVHITVNNLPDHLEKVNKKGKNVKGEHDPNIPDIYKKVADYYYRVLEGFHVRGVKVDQLDLLNEPGGAAKFALYQGRLFSDAIEELKLILADPSTNPYNIEMPEIVGPSTWGVTSSRKWVEAWQGDLPQAWENVDVLSTHGYSGGWISQNYTNVSQVADGRPFYNNEQTGKLQSGDGLHEVFGNSEPDYIGDVSMAMRVSDAINGGVNAFFVFNLNNSSGNNAALIRTKFKGAVSKSKVYAGFKQVTSTQPMNSYRVTSDVTGLGNTRVVTFRNPGENVAYVHVTNVSDQPQDVDLNITANGVGSAAYGITAIEAVVSDETLDEALVMDETYTTVQDRVSFSTTPYSVNSFKITFDSEKIFPNQTAFNVALNKPTTVSSEYEYLTHYTSNQAVDGNIVGDDSRWLSEKGTGYPQWIEIDLQEKHTINSLSLYTGVGGYKNAISDFQLQKWDGQAWETILDIASNVDPAGTFDFAPTTADLLRVNMTQGGGKEVRLYEVEVMGNKAAPANLTATPGAGTLLTWDGIAGAGFETYNLYESLNGGAYQLIASDLQDNRYINSGSVSPGDLYAYVVTAVDLNGSESGFSNTVQVEVGPPTGLTGDINFDGVTDLHDALMIRSALRSSEGDSNFIPQADYNHNGIIDMSDYRKWITYFRMFLRSM